MIAYKGFTKDLTAAYGAGTYQFEAGKTYHEAESKCARTGFHCAEYPLDCLAYYPPPAGSRYFLVEAAGDINETSGNTHIACTELTLLKEMSLREMALHGMKYMLEHPGREWERDGCRAEEAAAIGKGAIAIARGTFPKAKGMPGAILGLLVEPTPGTFVGAKLFEVAGDIKADTWYTLKDGKIEEVEE